MSVEDGHAKNVCWHCQKRHKRGQTCLNTPEDLTSILRKLCKVVEKVEGDQPDE